MFLPGFSALLRPVKTMQARRSGLVLPRDLLDSQDAYVSISTRRVFRRQHTKMGQRDVVCYLDALCGNAPPDQLLFGMSTCAFRMRWDLVFRRLGFDASTLAGGLTPACLRGSGATALYRAGVDLRSIAWLGRWARQHTLECYIQEIATASAMMIVPEDRRERIQALAAATPTLLRVSANHLRGFARGVWEPTGGRGRPRRPIGTAPTHPPMRRCGEDGRR